MPTSFLLSMRPLRGALLSVSLLALAPAAEAAPKSLEPRGLAAKHTGRELAGDTFVERIVVKFHEGSRVRLRDNRLMPLASERDEAERSLLADRRLSDERVKADAATVEALLSRAPRIGAPARLFEEDEPVLEARKASGEEQSGLQLADLNLYFEIPLLPGTTAGRVADLVAELNRLEGVEVAYAEPPSEPAMVDFGVDEALPESALASFGMDEELPGLLLAADIPPTTPLFVADQGYLNAAPEGVDARYAWTVVGGRGEGVRVVDIEGGWRAKHEDMPALFYRGGTQYADRKWRNHGTAVLGEIVGVDNAYGVTGIVNAAKAGTEGIATQSIASAISRAATAAGRGGIILIEVHSKGPSDGTACTCNPTQCDFIAVEYWRANYDAIRTATANGVIVVEAAGNGSANLSSPAYGGAFNRNVRDSGAIIVGASTATTRAPTCWTNHGGRVDVHGWGERVYSMGYGNLFGKGLGKNQHYTHTFSGTSSASPIVVGAAASAQGVALANGRRLTSVQMRRLLRNNGTAQATSNRHIGPLPDLRKALPNVISGNY